MTAHSSLASPGATRAVLEEFGLAAKKRLGQNFLVSDAVVGRILELAELSPNDVVLEVGPGIGTLTSALLPRAGAVVAIEADHDLPPVLAATCQGLGRMALIEGDALRVGAGELRQAVAGLGEPSLPELPNKFVSNLPYQVAATLVLKHLFETPAIGRDVVMVQAEVADRIAARPGTKAYGAYTAKLALVGQVTGRFAVGPQNFMPAPHVDSAVVRIDRKPMASPVTGEPLSSEELELCRRVIDAAFAQRRKTIRNSCTSSGISAEALDPALAACGIDPRTRAEALEPEALVELALKVGETS